MLVADPAGDWAYLIDKILKGADLHSSIVSLSAKMATSGMNGGAAINLIQSLMDLSSAPRDERYWDRYYDIQRAWDSAQKFAPEKGESLPMLRRRRAEPSQ